jgi:hypothetical protein
MDVQVPLCAWLVAAIAQMVEHVIRNDGVGGSIPSCGTTTPFADSHRRPQTGLKRRFFAV